MVAPCALVTTTVEVVPQKVRKPGKPGVPGPGSAADPQTLTVDAGVGAGTGSNDGPLTKPDPIPGSGGTKPDPTSGSGSGGTKPDPGSGGTKPDPTPGSGGTKPDPTSGSGTGTGAGTDDDMPGLKGFPDPNK